MSTPKIIYYENLLEDEFSSARIKARKIDASYDYLGGFRRKIGRHLLYGVFARSLAYLFLKFRFGHKIVGKEKLKTHGKDGFYLYGNHTQPVADALIPSLLCFPRYVTVIVHPNNVSMPLLGKLTPCLGALPLPDDKTALKNFSYAMEERLKNGNCITIYPEAHIWPYCTHVRPFRNASFRYPAKDDRPVYCFTNTYHKRPVLGTTKIITYIDGPFRAPASLSMTEKKQFLRDSAYQAMQTRSSLNTFEIIKYLPKGCDPGKDQKG